MMMLPLVRRDFDFAIWLTLQLGNSAVRDYLHFLLPGDHNQAIVEVMSVDKPPWVARGFFHVVDEGMSNLSAVLTA